MSHQYPYGQPYAPYTQVAFAPHRSSTAHVVIAWIAAVLTAGYLLPWAIAATRNRPNAAAIALVDLLLGWSLVGWVIALVMACGANPTPTVIVNHGYAPWPVQRPQPEWSVPRQAQLPPSPPEATVIDPAGYDQTQVLPDHESWPTWPAQQPYDPPAYGSEHDHRR